MPKTDTLGRMVLLARVAPEIKDAVRSTALRLNTTENAYIEQAVVRCIAADSGKVALANETHQAEIDRLAAASNELIRLSNSHRGS